MLAIDFAKRSNQVLVPFGQVRELSQGTLDLRSRGWRRHARLVRLDRAGTRATAGPGLEVCTPQIDTMRFDLDHLVGVLAPDFGRNDFQRIHIPHMDAIQPAACLVDRTWDTDVDHQEGLRARPDVQRRTIGSSTITAPITRSALAMACSIPDMG